YGECALPMDMRETEFDAIRTSAFEASNDVRLLDKYYELDKTRNPVQYRLRRIAIEATERRKLIEVIQRGAKQAYEEGLINQISPKRQQRFFSSAIELLVNSALQYPYNSIFVMRRITGMQYSGANAAWLDENIDDRKKMEALKNAISESGASTIALTVQPQGDDIEAWLQSRAHDKYIDSFTRLVIDRLRNLISSIAAPSATSISASLIAKNEDELHVEFASSQLPNKWIEREKVDAKMQSWLSDNVKSAYIHINGGDASGKTAIICRLRSLLQQKDCYVIIRFVNLTSSSNFAHELWHGICSTLCAISAQSDQQILSSFHLSSILSIFKSALQKLERPLYLLLDDVNLIKYGRAL
uniref:NACHT domain-containing protein n=1 Tax=Parascaris univalens TaxID=6257 RepID=A0A915BIS0_PARUN